MDYVYIDESGDLGFSEGSSKYFVITLMKVDDFVPIRRLVKRTRKKKLGHLKKKPSELKANKCSDEIRRYVLELLSRENITICAIIINKHKVYPYLRNKKERLYNYIIKQILLHVESLLGNRVHIILDKRSRKKVIRQDLDEYIKNTPFSKAIEMRVSHFDSNSSEELQALDFVAWAFLRKYEHGDPSYVEILKDKIKAELHLWGPLE